MRLGVAGAFLLRFAPAIAAPNQSDPGRAAFVTIDMATLAAWMDTLLPADGGSPAASELGVHHGLRDMARRNPKLGSFLAYAVKWLDSEAVARGAASFTTLPQPQRDDIAAAADAAAAESFQGRFFRYSLQQGYELYYSDPRSWVALGFPGPPQPIGFPDFAAAPRPADDS